MFFAHKTNKIRFLLFVPGRGGNFLNNNTVLKIFKYSLLKTNNLKHIKLCQIRLDLGVCRKWGWGVDHSRIRDGDIYDGSLL